MVVVVAGVAAITVRMATAPLVPTMAVAKAPAAMTRAVRTPERRRVGEGRGVVMPAWPPPAGSTIGGIAQSIGRGSAALKAACPSLE